MSEPGPPTRRTLFRGGHVYSPADPFATAMLVDGDRVAWIGEDGAVDAHRDAVDVVVDLDGALVTPAFVDAHVHATSTGLALTGLDLTGASSLAQALDLLERHARAARGHHVLGHGWDETRWPEGRPPTRQELDRASYGSVVYLTRIDVHSAVASSALLAALPEIRGLDGYDDSGLLTRAAHHAARAEALATVSPAQREAAQRAALDRAVALGIGSVHEMAGPDISGEDDLRALLALAAEGGGPDVVGYWGELHGVERALALGARGAAGDLFADGALGSHTACLRSPYADDDTWGAAYLDVADVREHVAACTRAGLQAGFHVIGDAAADTVVAGLSAAAEEVGADAVRARGHRLEHVELLADDHLRVLADLGVYASVQPVFDALWGGPDGMYVQRLGADRAATMNRFADMAAAGVALVLGSDAPVTPLGPWEAVRAAAFHHTPTQRLSVRAAFAAHTRGGWRAAGVPDGGVLVPGAAATYAVWRAGDLVVQAPDARVAAWSTDPRSGTPGLPDLTPGVPAPACARTVVRGRQAYDDGSLVGRA
ncbi:MAG: amidohydrolase family protein [Candidatus Nanopelagicales bacterium]